MSTAVLVDYIDEHRERFGVEPICRVLREAGLAIAPSTYYAAKTRPPSKRAVSDARHVAAIRTVHATNYGVYGVRRSTPPSTARATASPAAPCTG